MSKSANPGELRTPVRFVSPEVVVENGFPTGEGENVFGDGTSVRVKWVNAHGTDVFAAMQLQVKEPATLTCRYSPKIKPDCLVYRADDPDPYEIISIDNVEDRGVWLEIKVQRKEASR